MNKCVVIGLSGKRGSGKDTLAAQMAPHGWQKLSFAAELKKRCREDFGLTSEQTDGVFKESPTQYKRTDGSFLTPRDIMVRCGFYFRSIDPMYWVRRVYDQLDHTDMYGWHPTNTKFVITDVRFKNEADFIRSKGGIIVRLERLPELNVYKGDLNDPSETELDDYKFDWIIPADHNKTLKDLASEAEMLEWKYAPR